MTDNEEEWNNVIEIDEDNYKAVCDLIKRQHLDMTSEECINSILEWKLRHGYGETEKENKNRG
jgi:hypothetical protein